MRGPVGTDERVIESLSREAAGVVPVATTNPRNTGEQKDVEYRVEDRITEHSEDVPLKQSSLDETSNRWTGVERTNDAIKDGASGTSAPEAAFTHEQKCSLRCADSSSLPCPTPVGDTGRAVRSYEIDSMTYLGRE